MNFRTTKLKEKLLEKLNETLKAVLPILAIVLLLCFTIAPLEPGILLAFLLGAVLLVLGLMFFTLGVEMSMTPIGENVGTCMTQTRKLWLMVLLTFVLGFIVTISEPDLQVLAEQVPAVPNMVLILSVAFGVGVFLVASLLRMLYNITLAHMLIVLYAIVFLLAFLAPDSFIAVAFDAGGVTTGPMTVPFIMALGVGISSIRSDERAEKFLGVSIADEKELILIVTKTEMKNAIMKSIMDRAGLETKARAVVFSLPVTDTAGLRLQDVQ